MTKPLVFNYCAFEEMEKAYEKLQEENKVLIADNKVLRDALTNAEVKLRILEADKESNE